MLWSVISAVERAFHRFLNRPGSRDTGPGRLGGRFGTLTRPGTLRPRDGFEGFAAVFVLDLCIQYGRVLYLMNGPSAQIWDTGFSGVW